MSHGIMSSLPDWHWHSDEWTATTPTFPSCIGMSGMMHAHDSSCILILQLATMPQRMSNMPCAKREEPTLVCKLCNKPPTKKGFGEIDESLRRAFDEVLNEGVPDRFEDLLDKLRKGDIPQSTNNETDS